MCRGGFVFWGNYLVVKVAEVLDVPDTWFYQLMTLHGAGMITGTLVGIPYVLVLAIFFVLGSFFVLSRVPATMTCVGLCQSASESRASNST